MSLRVKRGRGEGFFVVGVLRRRSLRYMLQLRRGCRVVILTALRKRGGRGVRGRIRQEERVGKLISFLYGASEPASAASDAPLGDECISVMQASFRAMAGNQITGNVTTKTLRNQPLNGKK